MNEKKENNVRTQKPSSMGRREFVKAGATALILLPYVAPVVQSFMVNPVSAATQGSPPPGDDDTDHDHHGHGHHHHHHKHHKHHRHHDEDDD